VQVIDEDLGRSGSGKVERPGFERLVAEVCSGEVGAVLCIEASRLARNGRDWHHLIELCGLVRTVVIDPDGIYDPCILNDRLLLGLKGTMSEFELNLLRQRSLEAIRQKARRGELQFRLPVGYRWTPSGKIEVDPDRRVQQAVELIFAKVAELGSARQALLWFRREKVSLPKMDEGPGQEITWKLRFTTPYGECCEIRCTRALTRSAKRNRGPRLSMAAQESPKDTLNRLSHGWSCFAITMPGISVEQFERNQVMLGDNAHMKSRMEPKAGRGGRSLLAGLLRCRRCGRMLHVAYSGTNGNVPRYHCRGAQINHGEDWCISFVGWGQTAPWRLRF